MARWELYEGIDLSSHNILHHIHDVGMGDHPVVIGIRALVGPFERVAPQMEHLRDAQLYERLHPALQALRPLFHEHDFPVAHPDRHDIAVVTDIEEELPGAFLHLAAQVRQHVVAVDVNFEGLVAGLVACEKFLLDVRLSGGGQKCRQPILVGNDAVHHRACLDLARPAYEGRHAPSALPIGVFLGPERSDAGIRPTVEVDAVVGRVHDDGVFGDAELIELVQHHADVLVVRDHHVVVVTLAALALVLLSAVGPEVHGRRVVPHKERFFRRVRLVDEAQRVCRHFVVDGFHPLLRQRPGVLDASVRKAVDHPTRAKPLLELRVLRVIGILGLFFGIEVVEVAKELVETVVCWQVLVLVAKMVFPELAGGIAMRLEQLGDGGVFRLQADVGSGHPYLGQTGAERVLAGYKGGTSGGATLLAVVVGESGALVGHAVDVGRAVTHLTAIVVADVPPADVITPENQDVRFCWFSHFNFL